MQEMQSRSLGQEDHVEKEMTTHSSIFAWEILWTEEPGRLQSMESQRVGLDLATKKQQQKLYSALTLIHILNPTHSTSEHIRI